MQHKIIKWRRDVAQRWARTNPVLLEGEPGLETDTGKFKVGDGYTSWSQLPYFVPRDDNDELSAASLLAHIQSLEPHPAYDDGPSFLLLYQNRKV